MKRCRLSYHEDRNVPFAGPQVRGTQYLSLNARGGGEEGGVMARIARVIAPGCPHRVTQRGNRRQRTFFREANDEAYLALMAA